MQFGLNSKPAMSKPTQPAHPAQPSMQQPSQAAPSKPAPKPAPALDVITTEAQILSDGVCELVICIPVAMTKRIVNKSAGRDLSDFIHHEIIRRAIETYVY
jgi:hypothetical protein